MNAAPGAGVLNSDLAFWGDTAVQGTYEGFRLIDISNPETRPRSSTGDDCVGGTSTGNQGDVIVWGNLVFRSWNSGTPAPPGLPVTDPARYTTSRSSR